MADKTTHTSGGKERAIYTPYAADFEAGGNSGHEHKPSWTDGFPHDFHGWGPQTPEPDDELVWRGGHGESRHHVIWRFDRKHH